MLKPDTFALTVLLAALTALAPLVLIDVVTDQGVTGRSYIFAYARLTLKPLVLLIEEIGRDRFIVGSPETAITAIRTFQEQLAIDHLICRLFFPGMPHDHIMSEIKLLAEEVIPAFR